MHLGPKIARAATHPVPVSKQLMANPGVEAAGAAPVQLAA